MLWLLAPWLACYSVPLPSGSDPPVGSVSSVVLSLEEVVWVGDGSCVVWLSELEVLVSEVDEEDEVSVSDVDDEVEVSVSDVDEDEEVSVSDVDDEVDVPVSEVPVSDVEDEVVLGSEVVVVVDELAGGSVVVVVDEEGGGDCGGGDCGGGGDEPLVGGPCDDCVAEVRMVTVADDSSLPSPTVKTAGNAPRES